MNRINSITFSKNSELQTIEREVFNASTIERFTIPIHMTKIGDCAFSHCKILKRAENSSKFRTSNKWKISF